MVKELYDRGYDVWSSTQPSNNEVPRRTSTRIGHPPNYEANQLLYRSGQDRH